MDFGNKIINKPFNDLTTNRGDTKSKKLEKHIITNNWNTKNKILEKQENPLAKLIFKPLFIGSDFREQYIINKGIINGQTINCLIDSFKKIFNGEWFMITYNIEYDDIYYNLTTCINDKTLTFIINNKKSVLFVIVKLCCPINLFIYI